MAERPHWLRFEGTLARAWLYGAYTVLYVFLDWVSYIYPVLPLAITPWNPPPGLSLVLLFAAGVRSWPALFGAAFLAEVLVREIPASPFYMLVSSAIVTGGYVAIARTLSHFGFDPRFSRRRDLFWLTLVTVPGTLVIALLYVGLYALSGLVWSEEFLGSVLRFWVGDMIGVMVTVPLLLVHGPSLTRRHWRWPSREELLQAFSIALTLWVIFGIEYTDEFKFFYLTFLPLIWIAMRHGIEGASLALPAIQVGLIATLHWGGYRANTVVEFQFLMLALTITGLFLGMSVGEQRRAQDALTAREAELHQAQRLVGAGEMASALAHELNQPLAAIANYARASQIMLDMPGDQHERLAETMQKMVAETGRAARVVERLREFFRAGALKLEPVDPGALLRSAVETVARRAEREGVSVRVEAAQELPVLHVDRVHIETALHNLLLNAIEATAGQPMSERRIVVRAQGRADGAVAIRVWDSGPGISSDMAARLFQPFATSKPSGMGLGLVISRTLVEAHGGNLAVVEEAGTGACFELILPPSQVEQPHGRE